MERTVKVGFNNPPSIDDEELPTSAPMEDEGDEEIEERVGTENNPETPDEVLDVHEEEEDEPEEEAEEAHQKDATHHYKKQRDISEFHRVQRERHKYANALQQMEASAAQLADENARLRALAEEAYQSSTFNLSDALESKLKIAKEKKIQAYESGDVPTLTDLDVEISRLSNEINENNRIKAQHDYHMHQQQKMQQSQQHHQPNQEQLEQHQRAQLENIRRTESQRWLIENSWANKNSTDYNKELDYAAEAIVQNINSELNQSGRTDLMWTRPYFEELDNRMSQYLSYQQSNVRRPLNMKSPNVPVSSVRPSMHRSSSHHKVNDGLTKEERSFAKMLGEEGKYFKQAVERDKKLNKHLRVDARVGAN